MSVCPNCGKHFEDSENFCGACGAKLEEMSKAAQVEQVSEVTEAAQAKEGAQTEAAFEAVEQVENETETELTLPKRRFGVNKKLIGFGVAALAIIICLAIGVSTLFTDSAPNYSLYIKDGELLYYGMQGEPWQVADDMYSAYGYFNLVSNDRDKIFFQQDGDLYYREINSKNEPTELGTHVSSYTVSRDGKRVAFKNTESSLYIHDFKERTKIDSEVSSIIGCSENLNKIVYTKNYIQNCLGDIKFDLYLYDGKETVRLETDVSYANVSNDLSVVYYQKNNDLYSQSGTNSSKIIAEDISQIIAVYESGEVYYAKNDKQDEGWRVKPMSVYYYDGKKSLLVAEKISSALPISPDTPILAYSIDAAYNANFVPQQDDLLSYYIAVKDNSSSVDGWYDFVTSPDGKSIYYLEKERDDDAFVEQQAEHDLYKIDVLGNKIGEPKLYDTDVSLYSGIHIEEDGTVWYFKDYTFGYATLYKDKKKIESNVDPLSTSYCSDSKTLAYYVDQNTDVQGYTSGTLYFSLNGKMPVKVAEDVYHFQFTPDGQMLYLKDRSEQSGEGDLYLNKFSKKSEHIDEDVSELLPVYTVDYIQEVFH